MTDDVRLMAMRQTPGGSLVPVQTWEDAITEEEKDAAIHGEVNDYSVIAKFDAAFNPEGDQSCPEKPPAG